ncbi:hypothetical protein [Methylobacter sp. YRD-M1]|uniref:hypothetical protein n=1 Tax=Methylobacter sp. YRD-M1 TaxID=2911520 RepID=UPI00227CF687|nr:hypothetical protein [Methylobacter sp. YRD-M1]WAK01852.1 hypothetical protein LZ558_18865 [Methylobacter sp. YRD-M1]
MTSKLMQMKEKFNQQRQNPQSIPEEQKLRSVDMKIVGAFDGTHGDCSDMTHVAMNFGDGYLTPEVTVTYKGKELAFEEYDEVSRIEIHLRGNWENQFFVMELLSLVGQLTKDDPFYAELRKKHNLDNVSPYWLEYAQSEKSV